MQETDWGYQPAVWDAWVAKSSAANLGDQQSDLDGGYSERNYKLPNPFYLIP